MQTGPVPKRSSERRRRNADSKPEVVELERGPVEIPPADDGWNPIAREWYLSLGRSGQSQFFEPSDWAAAFFVAEVMTRNLEAGRFSSELFKGVWGAMSELLTTEGARRRARMEIEREIVEAGVTDLDEFKRRLANG